MTVWQHLKAILILPTTVAVIIPTILLAVFGLDTLAVWQVHFVARPALLLTGIITVIAGLMLVVTTIRQFVTIGRGTLAPWNPTRNLVVEGIYRYVRNPMISGVMAILLGEALASASIPLLVWFVVFATGNAIYIPLSEEQGLVKRFGDEYEVYRQNVPRWIPRLKPWRG